ncbi:MAG TPA: hydantoinase/oxoprolinase family protein [Acidimicrobiales bacterium]|nr:hydantoinase/oxoprolinase family protein [Acidimicrobiales bacterium]
MQVGVDTGGTFTDLVTADGTAIKVLSTPDYPVRAMRQAIEDATPRGVSTGPELLAHGTTVATNALLERRGAAVALITTEGLADVIEIGRQDRPLLYDQLASRPEPLVPRGWRYEIAGRLAADGSELAPVDPDRLPNIAPDVEAVAVCLLHADIQPAQERVVADALRARGHDVSCSHEVSPEMREVERTVTTVINAALRPRCRTYLRGIADLADDPLVMTSAGGLLPAAEAAELPAALLLSGPAGGVRAGAAAAVANGFSDAITFDMGGTSTDVCLVVGGSPAPAAEREVAGFTVRFPALDVHTIGAGGGSIARIDAGGALVVGPQSAGADPGPACYRRGGIDATVTDANLVAGRITADAAFGGLRLDTGVAARALDRAGVTAEGVIAVVDANMERALRAVSVERGVDPQRLGLVAFGGAGPLHACALAEALGMPAVIVPARAGVLSAVGLLTAPVRRDVVRSWPTPQDHAGLAEALAMLGKDAAGLVGPGVGGAATTVETAVDCRYRGQSHELTVPSVDELHDEHRRRNGYARPDEPVEVVALRAVASRPPTVAADELPAVARLEGEVQGPAVIAEPDCTIWVADGWTARAGAAGALVMRREAIR